MIIPTIAHIHTHPYPCYACLDLRFFVGIPDTYRCKVGIMIHTLHQLNAYGDWVGVAMLGAPLLIVAPHP